jgi:electron transport complex protein RnfG
MGMAAALGFVYSLTKEPIEKAKKDVETGAIKQVVPDFDNAPVAKVIDGITYYEVTKGGAPIGCAVKTFTDKAFSGRFDLMVGFLPDGTINKIAVLDQKETPGLGTKMMEPKFKDQFNKKNPGSWKMTVKKDGGVVDAISAATITSRAFCDAVQRGFDGYMKIFGKASIATPADTTKKGE